ncbi:MAG: hypothetical protein ACFFAS_10140 [Promethearchaeota archaeon]
MSEELFKPERDGWSFDNFTGMNESWDLFRKTYSSISPEESPDLWDLAFYEIFKKTAKTGNCVGISLLGLALFKFGSYLCYCAPASAYKGDDGPFDQNLRDTINYMHARQLSAPGLSNFIRIYDAGNINNGNIAFDDVVEFLNMKDYPLLSVARSLTGTDAHVILPYNYHKGTNSSTLEIWDSDYPYDKHPGHYESDNRLMTINHNSNGTWSYHPIPSEINTKYSSSGGAWCFAIRMSLIRPKAPHPLNPGIEGVDEYLMTIFLSNPSACIAQITDSKGRQFYTTFSAKHTSLNDIEVDPNKKLRDLYRWPWFGMNSTKPLPELYFGKPSLLRNNSLNINMIGDNNTTQFYALKSLICIKTISNSIKQDTINISRISTPYQAIEISTEDNNREFLIEQSYQNEAGKPWRKYLIKDLALPEKIPLRINLLYNDNLMLISSSNQSVTYNLEIQQKKGKQIENKEFKDLHTTSNKTTKLSFSNLQQIKNAIKEERVLDSLIKI